MHLRKISTLFQTNLHFVWVILFFIIHGYAQAYRLVPLTELAILTCEILVAGTVLFLLSTRFLRSRIKGGIFTSAVLLIFLFFGVFQDFFSEIRLLSIFSFLRPLIIISFIVIVLFFLFLKKTNFSLKKIAVYINSLFILYLLIDIFTICFISSSPFAGESKNISEFKYSGCDTCKPPSVYLVVMDEYLGSEGLDEYFNYPNASFQNFLEAREFRLVKNATSNYQLTLFSMASLLNMRYVPEFKEEDMDDRYVYNNVLSLLKNNIVCNLFQHNGYRIVNLSPFEIRNAPSEISSTELPQRIELITAQTMVYRIRKYMPGWLQEMRIVARPNKNESKIVEANELAMEKAISVAKNQDKDPVFTYVHLMMPHSPFVYDSLGKRTGFWSQELSRAETDRAYLQYLIYTNRRIERFITQLQQATRNKAIIQLISDHGYRDAGERDIRHVYQAFNSIFLPGKNYEQWYDGMTNVNQFRVLLNSVFGENLALLKDSIVHQKKLK